jgi:hypothetical protein
MIARTPAMDKTEFFPHYIHHYLVCLNRYRDQPQSARLIDGIELQRAILIKASGLRRRIYCRAIGAKIQNDHFGRIFLIHFSTLILKLQNSSKTNIIYTGRRFLSKRSGQRKKALFQRGLGGDRLLPFDIGLLLWFWRKCQIEECELARGFAAKLPLLGPD